VQEHEQVGKKQEECYPEDGREGYEEFVGAGIHQRPVTSGKGQGSEISDQRTVKKKKAWEKCAVG